LGDVVIGLEGAIGIAFQDALVGGNVDILVEPVGYFNVGELGRYVCQQIGRFLQTHCSKGYCGKFGPGNGVVGFEGAVRIAC
jgi:hypothetical protein